MPNYRSKLEAMVHHLLGKEWLYEPFKVSYVSQHTYTPDFVATGVTKEILVEVKGYFRPGDTQKYKAIRDSLPAHQELVFFLSSPFKKVRKGAMLSMSQWCAKEGFPWFIDGVDLKEYANGHI